jgi:F-type H+-transporting ATPase subunit alpha
LVPINKVKEFEKEYLTFVESHHPEVLAALKAGQFSDELTDVLTACAKDIASKY